MADQVQVSAVQDTTTKAAAKAQTKAERAAAKAAAKAEAKAEKECQRAEKERERAEQAEEEKQILTDLRTSLKTHAHSATFACGGSVSFKTLVDVKDHPNAIDPVHIRFGESGKGITLTLPIDIASSDEINALVKACQPASFGRGNEEVLDESYRKAGKLDRAAFATTFCPYEAGIVDVVAQLLMPQTKQDKHHCSIKAELYKLNVYSGPSGKFKAHVDTPRSEAQIGSLVVCLPVDHEGGTLAVRNAGSCLDFDWSTTAMKEEYGDDAPPTIKWAAFYSDCEHEVFEVTSGHRVTLTYNLYVSRGLGHLAGVKSTLDPTQLPLYETLGAALDSSGFLRHGRILAVWLNHSYAHTSKHLNFLPSSLKGADMALYETAQALGLWCLLGPVISTNYSYHDGSNHHMASKFYGFNQGNNGSGSLDPEGGMGFGYEMQEGKVTWINPLPKKSKKGDSSSSKVDETKQFKEPQMAYMTYGNEPGIDIWYSRAIMLIRVPPYRRRGDKHPESFWANIRDDWDSEAEYCNDYSDYDDYYDDEDEEDDYGDDDEEESENDDEDKQMADNDKQD